jgi:molybdenum cofactor cytidylyltransferase
LIFGPVATAEAAGAMLAHALLIDGNRWSKGRVLSDADVSAAHAAGVATVIVARLTADDIAEDDAAAALAAAFAGAGVIAAPAAHGRANLVATADGLFRLDTAAIDAVNSIDESITLGTLGPMTRVAAGEVVATVKLIRFAVPRAALTAAVAAAVPLAVIPFAPHRFRLIQTRLPATSDKMLARTYAVTRARVAALGGTLEAGWAECAHTTDALAACLTGHPDAILLIAGASATADRRDVIPAAIVAAGGAVERLGMPVDPGNLLCLGSLGPRAVIGLPGCARSPKRNGFDWVLERLAAGIAVTSADVAVMGVGGLLPEAERPQPRIALAGENGFADGAAGSEVGAIVLAAGRSSRMGLEHKLLADLGGKPVIAHVVDRLAAAGLPPPVVVLGHHADDVRAALGDRAAIYVTAPDFAEGMSHSLRAGLAAAPAGWGAAIVALGDMPAVDAATYAALVAELLDRIPVVVPTWNGKRGNPVGWSRTHWPALMAVTGDGGGKALLAALSDRLVEVAVDDAGILTDVDTPAALAALRDQRR